MTSIWHQGDGQWKLLSPAGYPDERTLHAFIESAPQLLPLAGRPNVLILGREVQLGTGYADLLGLESSGRPVVIEVKLSRNAEARRAVVAQVLAYASYLFRLDQADFEQVLGRHLRDRGFGSLLEAMTELDQTGEFVTDHFVAGLSQSLTEGRFRLVFVLDEAPGELVRLVGYLEAVSDRLTIDLITVSSFEVGGATVVVPQRVEPERVRAGMPRGEKERRDVNGQLTPGPDQFLASIESSPESERAKLRSLCEWAISLEQQGLATLATFCGVANRWTLLPRLPTEKAGLVTIWNEGGGYLQYWRSVFERRAPASLVTIEAMIAPTKLGKGTTSYKVSQPLLDALKTAYKEATGLR
ncbi:MAG: hypothetical protein U0836_11215 [Pirellulales bacterium]